MKKFIYTLEKSYQLIFFAVLGLALVIVPQHIVKAVPYVLGVGLILLAILNAWQCYKDPARAAHPGRSVVYLAVGLVALLIRADALGTLGVIWAMLILMECAEEFDEMFHEREIHPIPLVWSLISIVLAVMLMHDPVEHFVFHMRILGLEIIAYSAIRWMSRNRA